MNKPLIQPRSRRAGGRSLPMLSAEEELRLARAWKDDGDVDARNKLVAAFMPLAMATARRYTKGNQPPDADLVQQAQIGLIKAADRFDPDKGFRFSTYAAWWLRAEIQDYSLSNWSVVGRGNSAQYRKAFFNLKRVEQSLEDDASGSQHDKDQKIAKALGITIEKVDKVRRQVSGPDQSLNAPAMEDGEDMMARLADTDTDVERDVMVKMDTESLGHTLVEAVQALPDREREIIIATQIREPAATLETLGTHFGISKERVRQLRERAFQRLRDGLSDKGVGIDSLV
ncbi:sigma-70 family RNA polymerase sigma factor [Nioella nitratireducens]|uniref:sigma-70 family RNA polymerase sigma factor n=1 Tax=Nioella nitratireducens TaxID=1287720 RepID=UPI0008FCE891|nr:sigma-70 family RNA polymerase sigma factor [Nioella nitratireducens]